MFTGRAVAGEYSVSIYPYPGTPGGRGSHTLKKKYTIEPTETNDISATMESLGK